MPAKRIYLAGPMTGLPEYNYPAFHAEAARLRGLGFHVENPAENRAPACGTWEGYMRIALRQMLKCEAVAFLPGWAESRGALLERYVAQQVGLATVPASSITEPLTAWRASDNMPAWRMIEARVTGAAQQPQSAEAVAWPLLERPAKVGAGTFAAGLSARLVVEAAYRQHEYATEPPFTDEQIKALAKRFAASQASAVPDALREAVIYLDLSPMNSIASGSKLHMAMRDAIESAPATVQGERWQAVCGDWQDSTLSIHGERTGYISCGIPEKAAFALIDAHNAMLPLAIAAARQEGGKV